jgi:D-galactarolactone isomerase
VGLRFETMSLNSFGRRPFLQAVGAAVLSSTGFARLLAEDVGQSVPNSSGTSQPALNAPPKAADCHVHIFDPSRFQPPPEGLGARMPSNDTVSDYRLLQKRIRTTRVVFVTPRSYVTDNHCTMDAVAQMAPNARGVAVLRPDVTDAELKTLDKAGIRGIRFTTGTSGAVVSVDMIEPLAKRIADFGWHVQLYMSAEQTVQNADMLRRLPTPIVFDHLGGLPQPEGISHPAYTVIRGLIDRGRTWVKLSGAYISTKTGPPTYADVTSVAQAYVKAAPERLVWGSDWPHQGQKQMPDDAVLFDLLTTWVPDPAQRNRILVDNPETFYGFSTSI